MEEPSQKAPTPSVRPRAARLLGSFAGVIATVGAFTGCSALAPLTLDSTCQEYLDKPSDVRRDELTRLGAESKWVGAGNPLYLVDFEVRCAASPAATIGSVMGVE